MLNSGSTALAGLASSMESLAEFHPMPDDMSAMLARWGEVVQAIDDGPQHTQNKLGSYVIHGSDPGLSLDQAGLMALVQRDPLLTADLKNQIARQLDRALRPMAADHAKAAHKRLSARFNEAADKFRRATDAVDPEEDSAKLVTATDAVRTAWLEAEVSAHELDALLSPLRTVLELTDSTMDIFDAVVSVDDPLDDTLRRATWAAWEARGRTGRWGALAKLEHVTIRAASLEDKQRYRRPRPIETRYQRTDSGYVRFDHDPELGPPPEGSSSLRG